MPMIWPSADTAHIDLPDGSAITGQTTFVINGTTRTSANVSLMAEGLGATVADVISVCATRTVVSTGRGETGHGLFVVTSGATESRVMAVNPWDMDGDSVFERVQRITTTVNGSNGEWTETVEAVGADDETCHFLRMEWLSSRNSR